MIMSWMDSYVIFRTGSVMRIYCFMGRQIMLASWSQTSAACLKLVATCVIFAFVCVCVCVLANLCELAYAAQWSCTAWHFCLKNVCFWCSIFVGIAYIYIYTYIYIYIHIYIYICWYCPILWMLFQVRVCLLVCVCVCVCVCLCTLWFMYCHCGTACYSQTFWPSCLLWHVQCCN